MLTALMLWIRDEATEWMHRADASAHSRAAAVHRLSIAEEPTARPAPGSVAAHTSPAALAPLGGLPCPLRRVGRRQPRADGVHNDRCRGQILRRACSSEHSRAAFADSIPRCRAASDCEAEGRIGVGAKAATHVDDPRVCTSPQQRQKRLNHSPAAEQVDLHNALGGLQVSCTADLRQST
jgi:hypothetical protein